MLPVHGIRQLELPVGDLQEAPTGLVVEAYLAVASCDHQEGDLVLQTGPVQLLPGRRAENGASNVATQEARGLHVPEGDRGAGLELRVAHPAPGQGREGHLKGDVDGLGGFPSPMVGGQALAIPGAQGLSVVGLEPLLPTLGARVVQEARRLSCRDLHTDLAVQVHHRHSSEFRDPVAIHTGHRHSTNLDLVMKGVVKVGMAGDPQGGAGRETRSQRLALRTVGAFCKAAGVTALDARNLQSLQSVALLQLLLKEAWDLSTLQVRMPSQNRGLEARQEEPALLVPALFRIRDGTSLLKAQPEQLALGTDLYLQGVAGQVRGGRARCLRTPRPKRTPNAPGLVG